MNDEHIRSPIRISYITTAEMQQRYQKVIPNGRRRELMEAATKLILSTVEENGVEETIILLRNGAQITSLGEEV